MSVMSRLWLGLVLVVCLSVTNNVWGQAAGWGHVTGKIKVVGAVPAPAKKNVDKDQAVCTKEGDILDENLLVDKDGHLRDVFVMMVLKSGEKVPVHESYAAASAPQIVLDNINCRFVPHTIFVRTGQKLTLKNSDDVGHNCHITTFGNEENVNLPAGGAVDVTLKSADKVPGGVVCDIHKWMDATILVRDEPYAAISGVDGTFRLENVPAGTWKFQFWHKKSGFMSKLKIEGFEVSRKGEIEVTVKADGTVDLGEMTIAADALNK